MPGVIGWTTKLDYTTHPTPGTYTAVAESVSIQIPGVEVTVIEDTHLGVTDRFRTFGPGLRDSGSFSVEVNYSKATMNALDGLTGSMRTWRITAPDEDGAGPETAPTFTFAGFISKREPVEMKADELAKIKFDVKITGAVTRA